MTAEQNKTSSNDNSNLILQKLRVMLGIQDELNKKVNSDWRNAGYEWRDAIMVEAVELFDHLNWKWWKKYKTEPDWGQVRMEAVDIWHFIMSEMLCDKENCDFEGFISTRGMTPVSTVVQGDIVKAGRCMVAVASGDHGTIAMLHIFLGLLCELGMSFDDLYRLYIGKAKLNELRWANGYGTDYVKNWFGEEDNQVLTRLANGLDSNDPEYASEVARALAETYSEVKAHDLTMKELHLG